MKNICVITGTRADYGHLKWVLKGIKNSKVLNLRLIATGSHLSNKFGSTYKEIENDNFKIYKKIDILMDSDNNKNVSISIALGIINFSNTIEELNPDMILFLGDRYELLAFAISALIANIPIAHIHGGEVTEGAFDEQIRHSLTKMSHIHFTSTKEYRNRIIQMGENPNHVFNVGAPGIDNIKSQKLMEKKELEKEIGFKFGKKNLLVTFHPITLENKYSESYFRELLSALSTLKGTHIIFTMPNADPNNRIIGRLIKKFINENSNSKSYTSLGSLRYLSCIKYVDGVVGNSSSGISEVPSFKKGTIDIGNRQEGRVKAESIISCEPKKSSILHAIKKLYSESFKNKLISVKNPYGDGGSSNKIVEILEDISLKNLSKKKFYDLKM